MPILVSLLTVALVAGAFGFALTRLLRLALLVRAGAPTDELLTGSPGERLAQVGRMVFGHEKVLEDRWSGVVHFCFLYGFMVLGVGHGEVVLEGATSFLRSFGREPLVYERLGLSGVPLAAYHLSQDLLAGLVLVAAGVALARRLSGRVARLMPRSRDAETILWLIVGLYVTFFALSSSSLLLRQRAVWDYAAVASQPISSLLASALRPLPPAPVEWLRDGAYWAHLLVFLGFACYIPISKHMHLVFAAPNIYFFRKERYGLPQKVDFEKEKFGVDRVSELPWKALLDSFACTECGRCNSACPAHSTGKPLLPMKVLHDVKVNLRYRNGEDLLRFRDKLGRPLPDMAAAEAAWQPSTPLLSKAEVDRTDAKAVRGDGAYLAVEGQVHVDELWACTTCAACVQACPVLIDSVPGTLISFRQSLVMMESEFPQEVTNAFKGMEVQGNPWGVGQDRREEWLEGLDVPTLAAIKEAEPEREVQYLFWVGCAGATDPRARKVQQALVKVLKAAGVDFAILGCEEKCTGDPARRMGNEYVWRQLAEENVETLKQYKFKKIFTTCPHCFNALQNDYRELGTDYSVQHHSELLAELLKDKRIPLDTKRAYSDHVTFHDPCYLSRYNGRTQEPRDVLLQIGVRKSEMEKSGASSFCCGAGGGRIFMEERIGKRVNVERTEQALATGASTIVVGCPFCMTMITDGSKAKSVDETVKVKDLAELVAERLPS